MLSVLMPFYNSEKSIEKAIDSILKQTFRDFSLYLIDDCSEDNSLSIAENKKKTDSPQTKPKRRGRPPGSKNKKKTESKKKSTTKKSKVKNRILVSKDVNIYKKFLKIFKSVNSK